MESKQPWLGVLSPEGQRREIPLTENRISIGREGHECDIGLGPDPSSFVSRAHCYLERRHSGWWLTENGKNATLLCRNKEEKEAIHGQILLSDGSTFGMLGLVDEDGTRRYWSLTLHDPGQTKTDPAPLPALPFLRYERNRGTLWRVQGKHAQEIRLTALQLKLIDYMIERNRHAYNAPVLCTSEELLEAIYSEPFPSFREDLNRRKDRLRHLVEDLHRRLEINSKEPKFLVCHQRQGYILYLHPLSR